MTVRTRLSFFLGFIVLAGAVGCGSNPAPPKAAEDQEPGPLPEGWQACSFDGGFAVDMPGPAHKAELKSTGWLGEFTVHVCWVPPAAERKLTYEVKWYDVSEPELAKADVGKRLENFKVTNFAQGKEVRYQQKPFSLRGLHGTDYQTFVPADQFVAHLRILAVPHSGKTRILCLRIRGPGSPHSVPPEDERRFFNSLRVP